MTGSTSTDHVNGALDTGNTDCKTPPKSNNITDKWLQDDSYAPVLLMHSSRLIGNQLHKRYQNFVFQQSSILSGALDICIGFCVCFHVILYMYIIFFGNTVGRSPQVCLAQPNFDTDGDTIHVNSIVDF